MQNYIIENEFDEKKLYKILFNFNNFKTINITLYFLKNKTRDYSVGAIAKQLCISRQMTYILMADLEEKNIILKTRKVSNSQFYIYNKNKKWW